MAKMKTIFLISVLVLSAVAVSLAVRPEFEDPFYYPDESNGKRSGGNGGDQIPGFFGPGGFNIPGFNIPGMGGGGGYGGGFGGPGGGYSKGGTFSAPMVCRQKGPCYGKKLTCPRRCFSSYSRSGKNYGYGGGGGGCSFDCQKRCIAYC